MNSPSMAVPYFQIQHHHRHHTPPTLTSYKPALACLYIYLIMSVWSLVWPLLLQQRLKQEEALDTLASLVIVERRKRSTHSSVEAGEGDGEGKLPKKTPSFLAPLVLQNDHSD